MNSLDQPQKKSRQPRIDFTREFFCRKWGNSFECICPPRQKMYSAPSAPTLSSPTKGIAKEMASFNYFSAPSIKIEGVDPSHKPAVGRAEMKGLVVPQEICRKHVDSLETPSYRQEEGPSSLYMNDGSNNESGDNFQVFDISPDLPFRVCFTQYPSAQSVKARVRTGAGQCLRPSNYTNFTSSYTENFIDFFKTKTPQELSLYRTPLVMDNRRSRPTIGFNSNPGLVVGVNSGPLSVNARPIGWKSCGNKQSRGGQQEDKLDFEVCVSGPIVIPNDYEW